MRKKPPCKPNGVLCAKKYPACQDSCPVFIAWKAGEDERNQAKYAAKELEWITYSDRVKKAEIKKQKEGRK